MTASPDSAAAASPLTTADVRRLLIDPSPQNRADIAGRLGGTLDNTSLNEAERALANDILRRLAADAEAMVREALVAGVKSSPRLPHDVALKLAGDINSVALPVIEFSTVLTDADLVTIIRTGDADRQCAVAARRNVSEAVSDVLIDEGVERAVTTLMANEGAQVPVDGYSRALERFDASPAVADAIAARSAVPAHIVEKLVHQVSENLRHTLVARYDLPADVATDLVMQARETAIMNVSVVEGDDARVECLVDSLMKSDRLTPSLMLRALCLGDMRFFEEALAARAHVPVSNMRVLLHDAGPLGLKSACDRAGLPATMVPLVRTAVQVISETEASCRLDDRSAMQARLLELILTQVHEIASDDLDYLMDRLGDLLPKGSAQVA